MGNIHRLGDREHRFDAANRLLESTTWTDDGRAGGPVIDAVQTNLYDGHGMRVRSSLTQQIGGRTRPSRTWYVYALDGTLLHERDALTGGTRDHVHLAGKGIAMLEQHDNHDTDQDGLPDYYERRYGLSQYLTSDARGDTDGDGLSNLEEYQRGTNPQSEDTDGDGIGDAQDPDHQIEREPVRGAVLDPIFDYLGAGG